MPSDRIVPGQQWVGLLMVGIWTDDPSISKSLATALAMRVQSVIHAQCSSHSLTLSHRLTVKVRREAVVCVTAQERAPYLGWGSLRPSPSSSSPSSSCCDPAETWQSDLSVPCCWVQSGHNQIWLGGMGMGMGMAGGGREAGGEMWG